MANLDFRAREDKYLHYYTEQVSDNLNDCRLKIVSSRNDRARWYRQRTLNANDEIVDNLIDPEIGKVVWHSMRPTIGWYLYISSPWVPKKAAVPMMPTKSNVYGSTPLSFSIATSIDVQYLASLDTTIEYSKSSQQISPAENPHPSVNVELFRAIHLGGTKNELKVKSELQSSEMRSQTHARTSSRVLSQGHARLRSTGRQTSDSLSKHISKPYHPDEALGEDRYINIEAINQGYHEKTCSELQSCHFMLTESLRGEKGKISRKSWLKWALDTATISVPLELMSCKRFSLLWLNPPGTSSRANSSPTLRPVEILRYENDPSWFNWLGKRRGKITMQHAAIRALKIDPAFWMAVALAYLEYVEERDGYHAAMDG